MIMKSYSYKVDEKQAHSYAWARVEGVDASYKDLVQVCNRIRGKETFWAIDFLEKAEKGEIPVLYSSNSKRLGHRRELGGRKGRYPKKSAKIVLKVLRSAIANGNVKGLLPETIIVHALANKKDVFPRLASKGLRVRSDFETARVEIVLREKVPKEIKPSEKPEVKKEEPKKAEPKKPEAKPVEKKPEIKKPKEFKKPEVKKEEPKKPEAKPIEKKPIEKKPEVKPEPKAEPVKPREEPKKLLEKVSDRSKASMDEKTKFSSSSKEEPKKEIKKEVPEKKHVTESKVKE